MAEWHRVDPTDVPADGRVRSVTVDGRSVALSRCGARLGALDNHCPHQGGPLGEGSIEKGWLRCPWHGYDYDPITGESPGGLRRRGADLPGRGTRATASTSRSAGPGAARCGPWPTSWSRRWWLGASRTCSAWSATPTSGSPTPCAAPRAAGRADVHRDPPRGRGGVRGERVRQAHRPARGVLRHRRAGLDQPAHRPVRRQGRPRAGARDLRAGAVEGARPGRVPGPRPRRRVRRRGGVDHDRAQPEPTTPSWRRSRSSTPSTGAASPTWCCPTRSRCSRATRRRRPPDGRRRAAPGGRTPPPPSRRPPRCSRDAAPAGDRRRPRRPLRHAAELAALAERLGAPVLTTFKAKGLVSDNHPLGCGVLGRSGTPVASWLMNESDLLVVFGASFAQPHRHRRLQADRPGRRRPDGASAGSTRSRCRCSATSASPLAALAGRRSGRRRSAVDQRPDVAARWAIWRAEKARRVGRRPRPRASARRRSSTR